MADALSPPPQDTSTPPLEEVAGLPAVPLSPNAESGAAELNEHTGSPLPVLQPLAEAARAYAARKDSHNTRRAYASDWQLFERWCLRQGLDPLVPDPGIVGLFLAAAADGHALRKVSVATLERRLAAITTRYRSAERRPGGDRELHHRDHQAAAGLCVVGQGLTEPPRVFRRLQLLRGWSHDEANNPVFPRGTRACGADGARP